MALNTAKWGREKARERYGELKSPSQPSADQNKPQKLGDANNLQGPGYDNDHRDDWVRGSGVKPGFDRS